MISSADKTLCMNSLRYLKSIGKLIINIVALLNRVSKFSLSFTFNTSTWLPFRSSASLRLQLGKYNHSVPHLLFMLTTLTARLPRQLPRPRLASLSQLAFPSRARRHCTSPKPQLRRRSSPMPLCAPSPQLRKATSLLVSLVAVQTRRRSPTRELLINIKGNVH
jgi:hypothetical protein